MASRQVPSRAKNAQGEYIETDNGNKISRRAILFGTTSITLGGRSVIMADVQLRGDLHRLPSIQTQSQGGASAAAAPSTHAISIGRFTVLSPGCLIKPPHRITRGQLSYYPVKIGEHVFIGPNSHISAVSIGSNIYIGMYSTLMPFCIVRDNVKILEGTVVPPHMVVPPGAIVGGAPARILGEVPDGWGVKLGGTASSNSSTAPDGDDLWVQGGDLMDLVRSIR